MSKKFAITTQAAIRAAFWEERPNLDRRKITDHAGTGTMHKADARSAFVEYVDALQRAGQISDALADRACL